MSRAHKAIAVVASVLTASALVSGCAPKADSKASASPTASAPVVDAGLLKPTLAQVMRYNGTLQFLKDTNATLQAMQKTASIKISDSKTLATFVTQMQASGAAAVLIGKGLSTLSSPDSNLDAATKALGASLSALGSTARSLDAVAMATAGSNGATKVKTLVTQLGDAVNKTKAVANYASAHAKDSVKF